MCHTCILIPSPRFRFCGASLPSRHRALGLLTTAFLPLPGCLSGKARRHNVRTPLPRDFLHYTRWPFRCIFLPSCRNRARTLPNRTCRDRSDLVVPLLWCFHSSAPPCRDPAFQETSNSCNCLIWEDFAG